MGRFWVVSLLDLENDMFCIGRSEPDGTRWRTGGEVKGKDANGVGSQQPCTVRRNMVYPLIRTPRLRVVDWTHPPSPPRFKWTRPFCWKTKSCFCACAITFRTCSTSHSSLPLVGLHSPMNPVYPSHPITVEAILMLFYLPRLCFQNDSFLTYFLIKMLYVFTYSFVRIKFPIDLVFLDLIIRVVFGVVVNHLQHGHI